MWKLAAHSGASHDERTEAKCAFQVVWRVLSAPLLLVVGGYAEHTVVIQFWNLALYLCKSLLMGITQ